MLFLIGSRLSHSPENEHFQPLLPLTRGQLSKRNLLSLGRTLSLQLEYNLLILQSADKTKLDTLQEVNMKEIVKPKC